MSPDGRLVAAGGFVTQRTAVWDVATQRLLYELPGTPGRFGPDSANSPPRCPTALCSGMPPPADKTVSR